MLNGKQLKQSRELLGISVSDIARRMFTSRQTIWDIETEKSKNTMVIAFYNRIIEDAVKEGLGNLETIKKNIDNKINDLQELKRVLD